MKYTDYIKPSESHDSVTIDINPPEKSKHRERFEPLDKIAMEKMEKEKLSADCHKSNAIVKFEGVETKTENQPWRLLGVICRASSHDYHEYLIHQFFIHHSLCLIISEHSEKKRFPKAMHSNACVLSC